jgi:hypothetical protein
MAAVLGGMTVRFRYCYFVMMVEWHTREFKVLVPKGLRVQVPLMTLMKEKIKEISDKIQKLEENYKIILRDIYNLQKEKLI